MTWNRERVKGRGKGECPAHKWDVCKLHWGSIAILGRWNLIWMKIVDIDVGKRLDTLWR